MRRTHTTVLVAQHLAANPDHTVYVQQLSDTLGLNTGAVWTILQRMLDAGWVTDHPGPDAGRVGARRRLYQLTPDGHRQIKHYLAGATRHIAGLARLAASAE